MAIATVRKPESYPYLRIAKKYGYPYKMILEYVDSKQWLYGRPDKKEWFKGREVFVRTDITLHRGKKEMFDEINQAMEEFAAIQRGKIDWITGEPL